MQYVSVSGSAKAKSAVPFPRIRIRDLEYFDPILKFFDADPGSGIFLTLDPGSGMDKFGSRIRDTG
jgi:hypothetical protein